MGSTIPRTPHLAATHFHAAESKETAIPGGFPGLVRQPPPVLNQAADTGDPEADVYSAVSSHLRPGRGGLAAVSTAAGKHDGALRQPPAAKLRGLQGPPRPVGSA